jgi:YbbR domain-containing protein
MRDWFIKDFYWKAFSLFMAVGIWLTVRRESEAQLVHTPNLSENTYGTVPVLAVSASGNVRQAQLVPQTIHIVVSGPPEIMNNLVENQIHAFVNLTGTDSARNLPYDVEIAVPRGVTVVEINPPQVTVTFPQQQQQ